MCVLETKYKKSPHKALLLVLTPTHTSSETLVSSLPRWLACWNIALPPSIDEPYVLSRADVLQNKSFITSGQINVGQIWFAHIQPVGGMLTSR